MSDSVLAHIAQEANSLMLAATDPQVVDLARLVRMLADAVDAVHRDLHDLRHDLRTQVLDHEDLGRTVDDHARRLDALERGLSLD